MDTSPTPPLSPSLLARAPHRLLFFVGAVNVLLAMLWWTCWLIDARWDLGHLPASSIAPGWVHAIVMQYQLLPPFMFGFLLTTFPKWTGQPDLKRWHYLPVGIGLLGGQVAVIAGMLLGLDAWVQMGDAYAAEGDDRNARLCYANALRAARNEPVVALPPAPVTARADLIEPETRDAHGLPYVHGDAPPHPTDRF